MRTDIIIKRIETDEERKGKAYVHWRSWQEAYPGIVDQGYLDGLSLQRCEETAFRSGDGQFIAKDGERVVGFVSYGACRDEGLFGAAEIYAIYILSEYYGQAIGYRLMQAALFELSEYRRIALWVLKENRRAIRFYERCGFIPDGSEQELVLGTPVKVVRMVLEHIETVPATIDIVGDNYSGNISGTRKASRALIIKEGMILLSHMTLEDQWMLPGGGQEEGETPEACCVREAEEETGLKVRPTRHFLTLNEYYGERLYVNDYFACEIAGKGDQRLTEAEKANGLIPEWITIDEALKTFSDPDGIEITRGMYLREATALREYLKRDIR